MPNYWDISSATRIHAGGLPSASFADDSYAGGGVEVTILGQLIAERFIQAGALYGVAFQVNATFSGTLGADVKAKVFRPNGSTYDFVGESGYLTPSATGANTLELPAPILGVETGDILGFSCRNTGGTAISFKSVVGTATARFVFADVTSSNAFAGTLDNLTPCFEALMQPPFLAVTGDSIAAGYHTATRHFTMYDSGPSGPLDPEIPYQLRQLLSGLEYQNRAMNEQTFAWVNSTGMPAAVATGAKAILIHCGVNDINTSRTWAAVESDLDDIAAQLDAGQQLFIDEILPWTAGDDTEAATVRTWNANLATWCVANDAVLVRCHDAMGQTRVSTGELDDLKQSAPDYDQDGVHLTQAGVNAMAARWKMALDSFYVPSVARRSLMSSSRIGTRQVQ